MKTFQQLTKDFDYVNSDIEANFSVEAVPKNTEYKLWYPNKSISTEDALKEIEAMGYKPATLSHLLNWPDWNGKDWVAGLGSVAVVGGPRCCPYLDGYVSKRRLDLSWFADEWDALCRFLLVRNLDSETSGKALGDLDSLTLRIDRLEKIINSIREVLSL